MDPSSCGLNVNIQIYIIICSRLRSSLPWTWGEKVKVQFSNYTLNLRWESQGPVLKLYLELEVRRSWSSSQIIPWTWCKKVKVQFSNYTLNLMWEGRGSVLKLYLELDVRRSRSSYQIIPWTWCEKIKAQFSNFTLLLFAASLRSFGGSKYAY